MTSAQVRDNSDGSYMASSVAQQGGEIKISVSINGQQIKGSPYSIVVQQYIDYSRVGKPSEIVNKDGNMGQPWGIAFGKNGTWAVADNTKHCLYIFDGQDQLIWKVVSRGSSRFKYPNGVTFDSYNNLYVAEFGRDWVNKFDANGNYLLKFGSSGSGRGQLSGPVGVTTHANMVFVTDASQCFTLMVSLATSLVKESWVSPVM